LEGIDVSEIISWLPSLLQGLLVTIEITVVAMAVGLVLGIGLATMRLEPGNRWLYIPATVYIELMRGTPLILQLFFVYFALPAVGIRLDPFVAGVLAIGLNYSAYLSEVFRSSIRSVPRGQWEAASSLGMPWALIMWRIIFPQAGRLALPATGNYFIGLFKDSALASTISVTELLFSGQILAAQTFQYFSIYGVVALLYLLISYPASLGLRALEKRIDLTSTRRSELREVARTA
jgi:His/Glu/Gln/Arg/opine family amino acid ABC transporter permease subunit